MDLLSKEQQEIINKAKKYIINIFKEDSSGHDSEHSLRVLKNSMEIVKNLLLNNKTIQLNIFIIALCSLLHDVDDYKLNHYNKDNPYQNLLNFLESIELIKKEDIKLMKEII